MSAAPDCPKPTGRFAVVRPYGAAIRSRVFEFLESCGLECAASLEAGESDEAAATWAEAVEVELLVLPYNKHRDRQGAWVTGFGVAARLGDGFADRGTPVLMPVDEFTFASSFEREMSDLQSVAPRLESRLIVLRESQIGCPEMADRLREVTGQRSATDRP